MNDTDFSILRLAHQGYCCSQIILLLALEMQGKENPALIRCMSGLCHGFSSEQGACGALTGAACLLGYFAGKGKEDEDTNSRLPLMQTELAEWFEIYAGKRFGGINCAQIVSGGQLVASVCGGLISECFTKAIAILQANGFDPLTSPDD